MNIESTATRRPDTRNVPSQQNRFVTNILPWVIGATGLLIYLGTLNHWVSINSITHAARASGLLWQPELSNPLYWLATLPFRLLPLGAIPIALNLFSAVCAALTLCLLARSIALLPHDRTEEQRIREKNPDALLSIRKAWIPPVFAAVVCGLQLTFWEHATAASAEMLDLLIFAYLIRCLLEFRLDGRQTWLSRSSFIYAAAMANNWAMVAFFPVFLAAMIWIKGLSFFNLRFLMRMFVLGLAGLSFYLLLPIHVAVTADNVSFWEAMRHTLGQQWGTVIRALHKNALLHPEQPQWILALPALLPLLVMGVRWPSYLGDPSKLGTAISSFTFHLFHGALLFYCVYISLDPPMSHRYHSGGPALLTFYYLGALSIGYLSGYFFLVFGTKPSGRPRPVTPFAALIKKCVLGVIAALLISAPLLLIYKNLEQIRLTNGPALKQYSKLLADSLKPGSIALGDDNLRLLLVQLAMPADIRSETILLATGGNPSSLRQSGYHAYLRKRYGARWPVDPPTGTKGLLGEVDLIGVMYNLARTNTIQYLHPSFGYYFEVFYPEPQGLIDVLKPYPAGSLLPPPLSQEAVDHNLAEWEKIYTRFLQPFATRTSRSGERAWSKVLSEVIRALHIKTPPNHTASFLGMWNSRSLTDWGVDLQKLGLYEPAKIAFARALEMNPDNLVARMNLDSNTKLQKGEPFNVQFTKEIEDFLGRFGSWDNIMNINGPFDEPAICFQQALVFANNGHYRQSAQFLDRVKQLVPENLEARAKLAAIYAISEMPDHALKEIQLIHANGSRLLLNRTNAPTLLHVEITAHLSRKDIDAAQNAVNRALSNYPDDPRMLSIATHSMMAFGYFTNALTYIEKQLKLSPDAPDALRNKGVAYMQTERPEQAIAALTRSLDLQVNKKSEEYYLTLFNRALAYLKSKQYENAQRDYGELYKDFPNHFAVNHGLGEIAFQKLDYRTAINHYKVYLLTAPTNTPEATNVLARLEEAKRQAM